MFINENFIKNLTNCNNVKYLFTFSSPNFSMLLTTGDTDVDWLGLNYKCGIIMPDIPADSLVKLNNINVQIINDYEQKPISTEELLKTKVKIKILLDADANSEPTEKSATIFSGFVSQIIKDNELITVTISPITSYLNQSICELFSPICRECFGNSRCGVNLENYKTGGRILEIISDDCFIGNHRQYKNVAVGYYRYGMVKFLNGKLAGIFIQLKDEIDGKVYLLKNTKLLSIGDKYEIFAGCDKTIKTCKEKFHNVINFRGEPFIEKISEQ